MTIVQEADCWACGAQPGSADISGFTAGCPGCDPHQIQVRRQAEHEAELVSSMLDVHKVDRGPASQSDTQPDIYKGWSDA